MSASYQALPISPMRQLLPSCRPLHKVELAQFRQAASSIVAAGYSPLNTPNIVRTSSAVGGPAVADSPPHVIISPSKTVLESPSVISAKRTDRPKMNAPPVSKNCGLTAPYPTRYRPLLA